MWLIDFIAGIPNQRANASTGQCGFWALSCIRPLLPRGVRESDLQSLSCTAGVVHQDFRLNQNPVTGALSDPICYCRKDKFWPDEYLEVAGIPSKQWPPSGKYYAAQQQAARHDETFALHTAPNLLGSKPSTRLPVRGYSFGRLLWGLGFELVSSAGV